MIILDTNVISALMQPAPDARVVDWLDHQPADSIWLTSITVFELRFGLATLPAGKRRRALEHALVLLLHDDLEHRVLDFDTAASVAAATLAARRRRAGRPVDMRDTQIAGIALARHATLATRNVKDFADSGVTLVNPWAA